MRSYLRYYEESLRLPSASPAQLAQRVRCSGDGPLREEFAAGRPVVAIDPHTGRPADTGILQVTAVAAEAWRA